MGNPYLKKKEGRSETVALPDRPLIGGPKKKWGCGVAREQKRKKSCIAKRKKGDAGPSCRKNGKRGRVSL